MINNSLTPKNTPKIDSAQRTFMSNGMEVTLSPATVKNYLVSGDASNVTTQEIVMFINLCKYQGLNPFLREAYLVKYGNAPATIVTGKEAMMKRAFRNPKFKGYEAGIVVYKPQSGNIENRVGMITVDGENLVGGWAKVFVDGYEKPIETAVAIEEYIGRKRDGSINGQWASKPATMIRKVALMQALREAFPEDLGGMYSADETAEEIPQEPIYVDAIEPEQSASEILSGADILGG